MLVFRDVFDALCDEFRQQPLSGPIKPKTQKLSYMVVSKDGLLLHHYDMFEHT